MTAAEDWFEETLTLISSPDPDDHQRAMASIVGRIHEIEKFLHDALGDGR